TPPAAPALPRTPSFEKCILTPPGASSKDSNDPKPSCTAIPAARNAAGGSRCGQSATRSSRRRRDTAPADRVLHASVGLLDVVRGVASILLGAPLLLPPFGPALLVPLATCSLGISCGVPAGLPRVPRILTVRPTFLACVGGRR